MKGRRRRRATRSSLRAPDRAQAEVGSSARQGGVELVGFFPQVGQRRGVVAQGAQECVLVLLRTQLEGEAQVAQRFGGLMSPPASGLQGGRGGTRRDRAAALGGATGERRGMRGTPPGWGSRRQA